MTQQDTQPPAETLALIAELAPLVTKASHPNGWEWMFPLRVVPVDGKPTIVSHKGGNLFRGYIATWDEADLLVSLANAAPRILAALTRRAGGDASCKAAPDHADIMETIQNAADDWQKKGYATALAEVRDMANVGRALMEALPEGYSYMDCPSEIVSDLQNERDDAVARAGGDAIPAGMSAVMGRILGHYSEDPGTLARIKGMVAQYREAPFRSAEWLAGEIMRILDSEPANDTTPKPPAGGDAGAVEAAHLAAFHAVHGSQADPFENPEAFDFCGTIADAVLAALSGGKHDAD